MDRRSRFIESMSPVLLMLVAYVVLVPVVLVPFDGDPHNTARILQLGLLALSGPCLLMHRESKAFVGQLCGMPARLGLGAFALLTAASVLHAAVPAMALREVVLMASLVIVAAAAARGIARSGTQALQVAVVVTCGLYAAVLLALTIVSAVTGASLDPSDLAVGYINYRFFNHIQTVTIPVLAFITLRRAGSRSLRRGAWFALVVNLAFAVGFGARGTVLAVAAAAVGAWLLAGRRTASLCVRLVVAGVAGALLYALIFWLLPVVFDTPVAQALHRSAGSLSSDSARLSLWRLALDDVARAPWTGIGPMHYAHEPNPKAAHPHNAYLQVAAEWGLPMLLLAGAAIVHGVTRLARAVASAADGNERAEGAALLTACLAVLLDALVSGNVVMPVPQMWIVLATAWAAGWMSRTRPADPPVQETRLARWAGSLTAMLFTASQLWLIASVWPEARDVQAHVEHVHRDIVRNARLNPRFWSEGWF